MSRFQRVGIPLESATVSLEQRVRDTIRSLADLVSNLASIFDKGVGVTDNLDVDIVSFTSNGTPDTEDAVPHNLGRVPVGFIVVSQDKAASVYASGTAWTKTNVYFKTSVASVALKVLLF